jgi:hypothetical protein
MQQSESGSCVIKSDARRLHSNTHTKRERAEPWCVPRLAHCIQPSWFPALHYALDFWHCSNFSTAAFSLCRWQWCWGGGGGGARRVPFQPFAACNVIDPSIDRPVPISPKQSVKLVKRDLLFGGVGPQPMYAHAKQSPV